MAVGADAACGRAMGALLGRVEEAGRAGGAREVVGPPPPPPPSPPPGCGCGGFAADGGCGEAETVTVTAGWL